MYWDAQRECKELRTEELATGLSARPTTWIRPFLQLAANRADPLPDWNAVGPAQHWYRLNAPDSEGACRFIWHPRGHPELFDAFSGTLHPEATDAGSALALRGMTRGGNDEKNRIAIDGLLDLLCSALAFNPTDS